MGSSGWNAGVSSEDVIRTKHDTVQGISFTPVHNKYNLMIGLNQPRTETSVSYTDIQFAFYCRKDGRLSVYESGANKGYVGSYNPGDVLQVRVKHHTNSITVEYVRSGIIVYTSEKTPEYPLVLDSSFHDKDASVASVQWVNTNGFAKAVALKDDQRVVFSGLPTGLLVEDGKITKTGSNGWNAGMASEGFIIKNSTVSGVSFSTVHADKNLMVGLSSVGSDTSASYAHINFALYCRSNGKLSVYEKGKNKGEFSSYAAGDMMAVRTNSGGQVEYVHQGVVIHQSSLTVSYPLSLDTAFHDSGASITSVRWTNETSASMSGCAKGIDGGGWSLVRHVPAGNQWYKATDQLAGTDSYGNYEDGPLGNEGFSVKFDTVAFSEFLFATGDCTKWLVAKKSEVTGGFYTNVNKQILKSSTKSASYYAKWYRRSGNAEDPWISLTDHTSAIASGDILYGENRYSGDHATKVLPGHKGANVFIR